MALSPPSPQPRVLTPRAVSVPQLIATPQATTSIRVEALTITPDIAAAWLTRNHVNRPLRRRLVESYKTALASGRWDDINGQTIIFADTGALLDGQHRLTAVVEAHRAMVSLVVFGVPATKRGSIDTGAKRQLSDVLGMAGVKSATNVAAALVMLHAYEQGAMAHLHHGLPFASYAEGQAFLAQHPGLREAVLMAHRIGPLLRPSHAALLAYVFTAREPRLAGLWADTLHDGQLRLPYAVFLVLRERLIRHHLQRHDRYQLDTLAWTIKAWNAARQGIDLKLLRWNPQDAIPAIL